MLVKVPPFSPRYAGNCDYGNLEINDKELARSSVIMYEIGSGKVAAELRQTFDIGVMKFSTDGRYLSLASKDGQITIWSIGDQIFRVINEVLTNMKAQPDYWADFPISLPDLEMPQRPI